MYNAIIYFYFVDITSIIRTKRLYELITLLAKILVIDIKQMVGLEASHLLTKSCENAI